MAENDDALQAGQGVSEIDDWAKAFAALDKENEESDEGANSRQTYPIGGRPTSDDVDQGAGAADAEAGDGDGDAGLPGGMGDADGIGGQEDGAVGGDLPGAVDPEEYERGYRESIRGKVIGDMAAEYAKRGVRQDSGKLGASIDAPDIMKRDRDGVPHFFNPETGREFTGDNPRKQAQEWVDDYNRQLADAFNASCKAYEDALMEQQMPSVNVLRFAPIYEGLDPIRQQMLDNVLEDYEVTDGNGDVIGYSCDLDKALAMVNRQVASIQAYARDNGATGPALDMKASGGRTGKEGKPEFKSIAEALEWEQDQELARLRNRRK